MMDDPIQLINHLIKSKYSIDQIDSIANRLKFSVERIHRILQADRYKDYFQLIKTKNHGTEKIALTLDLFCCTHYAQQCKNISCPFLHLCPYNIRPMHGKCTNQACPYDHDVLKSAHNKKIINSRGLTFLSEGILLELARTSADPSRSFWVCTDHGKKGGCPKKSQCEKFHYCYFQLINGCTKPHCSHVINEACIAYFRYKDLAEQDHEDILQVFRKVLRQRKPDFISTIHVPPHPSWAVTPSITSRAPIENKKESTSEIEKEENIGSTLSATAAEYNGFVISQSDLLPPLPEDERDIILIDSSDENDRKEIEQSLSTEIGFRMKLIISKTISSAFKTSQKIPPGIAPIHYYCPTETFEDLFQILRCQNEIKPLEKPLIIYSNLRDAHDATELNIANNQFCLLRVNLYQLNSSNESSLELVNPSIISFDRLWIYAYDDQPID